MKRYQQLFLITLCSVAIASIFLLNRTRNKAKSFQEIKRKLSSTSTTIKYHEFPIMIDDDPHDKNRNWTKQIQYMVLGVQKGGTTTLCSELQKHPQILNDETKERRCFKMFYSHKNPLCIDSLIPQPSSTSSKRPHGFHPEVLLSNPSLIQGDCSPGYIYQTESVIPRIAPNFPWLKFIVLLRDPIARFYSQYHMQLSNHKISISFEELILKELALLHAHELLPQFHTLSSRTPTSIQEWLSVPFDYTINYDWNKLKQHYKNYLMKIKPDDGNAGILKGFYALQLDIWMEVYPKNRFLTIPSEEFATRPFAHLQKIYRHLGIATILSIQDEAYETTRINTGRYTYATTNNKDMRHDTRVLLQRIFAPHVLELSRVLNKDWITPWRQNRVIDDIPVHRHFS